jgi:uncharacterized protein
MNRTFKAAIAALIFAVGFAGSAAAGPLMDIFITEVGKARPLAEQGHAPSQNILGAMYEHGWGVTQDYQAAVNWYSKAAAQDFAGAQFRLGVMYEKGLGVPRDDATAMSWYRKAAAQGHTAAQGLLGAKYDLGQGVPQDYVTAHVWLNLAAAGGDKEAAEARDKVAAKMAPAQIAEAQKLAREWKPK